jgi:hypothetical protein
MSRESVGVDVSGGRDVGAGSDEIVDGTKVVGDNCGLTFVEIGWEILHAVCNNRINVMTIRNR